MRAAGVMAALEMNVALKEAGGFVNCHEAGRE